MLFYIVLAVIALVSAEEAKEVQKKANNFCFVNGQVHHHGSTFRMPGHCSQYVCNNGAAELQRVECRFNGQCHAVGSRWRDNVACADFVCEQTGHNAWRVSPIPACRDNRGTCHDVNSRWTEDCVTYQCNGGHQSSSRSTVAVLCKDMYGKCHASGSVFPYVMHGRVYRHCVCQQWGHDVKYQCSG